MPWFNDPDALDRPITDDGPAAWKRADMSTARQAAKRRLPDVKVSGIHGTENSIEFDVSRTGVPVMVKTSYFPNWEAHGAQGPWRATPNFMVVVPTSKHVRLTFSTTPAEWLGRVGTLAGLAGLGALVWWGVTTPSGTSPAGTGPAGTSPADTSPADTTPAGGGPADGEAQDSGTDRRRRRIRFPSRFAR